MTRPRPSKPWGCRSSRRRSRVKLFEAPHGVVREGGHGARDRRDTRDDRHRNRQHIVDQQRGSATSDASSPRFSRLTVYARRHSGTRGRSGERRDDDDQQQHNGSPKPSRQVQQREPTQAQHQHDLLSRIRNRRQGVRAENRQRQPLRKQRLADAVGAQRLAEQQARNRTDVGGHDGVLASSGAKIWWPLQHDSARLCWRR